MAEEGNKKSVYGDVLTRIGQRDIYWTVNKFNGEQVVHLRHYFHPEDEEGDGLVPTKKGLCLTLNEFNYLSSMMNDIKRELRRETKKKYHDYQK